MKFQGRIVFISEVKRGVSKAGKDWSSISVVVEEEGQYPNKMCFDAFNKEDAIDGLTIGTLVEVDFNANCNEWNGKYYNKLNIFRIDPIESIVQQQEVEKSNTDDYFKSLNRPEPTTTTTEDVDDGDGLPF